MVQSPNRPIPFTRAGEWSTTIPAARFAASILRNDPTGAVVCLLGLPDDLGVRLNNGRTGAERGPTALRDALARYGVNHPHNITYPTVYDAGDIVPDTESSDDETRLMNTHARVSAAACEIVKRGMFPVAIGGGHDLTFAFVRGVIKGTADLKRNITSWHGLYTDAHLDVRDTVGSGMPFRKLIEECGVSSLGVAGLEHQVNTAEHYEWFTSHGGREVGIDEHPRSYTPTDPHAGIFVSIDLDCMPSAYAPGVSAPRAGGITPASLRRFLATAAELPGLCCLDFMELCPRFDIDGRTSRLTASLLLEFLSSWKAAKTPVEVTTPNAPLTTAITNARILTCNPDINLSQSRNMNSVPLRGSAMNDTYAIPSGTVLLREGRIYKVGADVTIPQGSSIVDAEGRVVMPAFVDCHTHACFAGERINEWTQKLAGTPYLQILASGGGIMSTVNAVRSASEDELRDSLITRFRAAQHEGTAIMEVKSGYGLTTKDELKMLRAITAASDMSDHRIIPTALLGHAIDNSRSDFVDYVINETLPAISSEFPGITIDAFCEQSAWSVKDCLRLFDAAAERGHPCRVHADQFNDLGFTKEAVDRGFVSVDHLEASTPQTLTTLAHSRTIGVGLPIVEMHLASGRYPHLRDVVDRGGAIALASNFNPGTAFSFSLPFAIAIAVRHCQLTFAQALIASTRNAACVVKQSDRGMIVPGAIADLIMLEHTDERMLAYQLGGNHIRQRFFA